MGRALSVAAREQGPDTFKNGAAPAIFAPHSFVFSYGFFGPQSRTKGKLRGTVKLFLRGSELRVRGRLPEAPSAVPQSPSLTRTALRVFIDCVLEVKRVFWSPLMLALQLGTGAGAEVLEAAFSACVSMLFPTEQFSDHAFGFCRPRLAATFLANSDWPRCSGCSAKYEVQRISMLY